MVFAIVTFAIFGFFAMAAIKESHSKYVSFKQIYCFITALNNNKL
jgi:hypothetical protein